MTSKEAFDKLLADLYSDCSIYAYNFEGVEQIYRDLEVLEIIKKYWSIDINSAFQVSISYKPTSPMGHLPVDETLKLKEWLENE